MLLPHFAEQMHGNIEMIKKQKQMYINDVICAPVLQLIICKNKSKDLFLAHTVFSSLCTVGLLLLHISCGVYGVLYRKD